MYVAFTMCIYLLHDINKFSCFQTLWLEPGSGQRSAQSLFSLSRDRAEQRGGGSATSSHGYQPGLASQSPLQPWPAPGNVGLFCGNYPRVRDREATTSSGAGSVKDQGSQQPLPETPEPKKD